AAGVQEIQGIGGSRGLVPDADRPRATLGVEELQTRDADPVLPGDRSTQLDRAAVELLASGSDARLRVGIAALPPEGGLQAAAPRVPEGAAVQATLGHDAVDGI